MTDGKLTDIVIQITSTLSELNANMKLTLDKLTDHERRLEDLERTKVATKDGIKDSVIQWLVKGLVVAILTIGSLTGASALIQKILTPTSNSTMEIQK